MSDKGNSKAFSADNGNVYENMSKDELLSQVKKQFMLLKKTKQKIDDLNEKCSNLEKEKKNLEKPSTVDSNESECDCDGIKIENEKLIEENQEILSKYESVFKKLKASDDQTDCMKLKMETMDATCQCLQDEIKDLQQCNQDQKRSIQELKELNESLSSELSSSQNLITELETEKNEWNQKFEKEIEKNQLVMNDIKELEDRNQMTIEEFNQILKSYDAAKSEIEDLASRNSDLKKAKEDMEIEFLALKDKFEETKALNENQLLQEKTQWQAENEKLKEQLEDLMNKKMKENNDEERFEKTDGELENLKDLLETSTTKCTKLSEELDSSRLSYEQKLQACQEQNDVLDSKFKESIAEKEELHSKLEALESETMDKVAEIGNSQLESELESKLSEIAFLSQNYDDLSKNHEILAEQIENERSSHEGFKEQMESTVSSLEDKISTLQSEKEELQQEILQDRELIKFLEDEAKSLNEENMKMKVDLSEMESSYDRDSRLIEEFNEKLLGMQEREQSTLLELDEWKEKLLSNDKEKDELLEKLKLAEQTIKMLQEYNDRLKPNELNISIEKENTSETDLNEKSQEELVSIAIVTLAHNKEYKEKIEALEIQRNIWNNRIEELENEIASFMMKSPAHKSAIFSDDESSIVEESQNDEVNTFRKEISELRKKVEESQFMNKEIERLKLVECKLNDEISYLLDKESSLTKQFTGMRDHIKENIEGIDEKSIDYNKPEGSDIHTNDVCESVNNTQIPKIGRAIKCLYEKVISCEDCKNLEELNPIALIFNESHTFVSDAISFNIENDLFLNSVKYAQMQEEIQILNLKISEFNETKCDVELQNVGNKSSHDFDESEKLKEEFKLSKEIDENEHEQKSTEITDPKNENLESKNKVLELFFLIKDLCKSLSTCQTCKQLEIFNAVEKIVEEISFQKIDVNFIKESEPNNVLADIQDKLSRKIEEFQLTKDHLTDVELQLKEAQSENEKLSDQNSTLSKHKESLQNDLEEKRTMTSKIHNELDRLLSKNEELESDINDRKKNIIHLETKLNEVDEKLSEHINSMEQLKQSNSNLEEEMKAKNDRINSLIKYEVECQNLQKRFDELNVSFNEINSSNSELSKECENLKKRLDEMIKNEACVQDERDVGEKMKKEFMSLQTECYELSEKYNNSLSQMASMQCDVDSKGIMIDDLNEKSKVLNDQLGSYSIENSALQEENNRLKEKFDDLNFSCEKMKVELDDLTNTKIDLLNKIQELTDSEVKLKDDYNVKIQELQGEIESHFSEKSSLDDRCERLAEENSDICEEFKNLEETQLVLQEQLQASEHAKGVLKKEMIQLEELTKSNTDELNKKVQLLEEEMKLKESSEQSKDVENQNEDSFDAINEINKTCDELKAQNEKFDSEISELKLALASENKLTENLKAEKELQNIEIDNLKQNLTSENELKTQLMAENEAYLKENANLKDELNKSTLSVSEIQKSDNKVNDAKLKETEEKLLKVKTIAVKAKKELAESKKKLSELTLEKNSLQSKVEHLNQESNSSLTYIQNYQSLQIEFDKAQDRIEDEKIKSKTFEQDLQSKVLEFSNLKANCISLEEERNGLNKEIDKLNKEKVNLSKSLKEIEAKLICAEEEKKQDKKRFELTQGKLDKANNRLEDINKQLKEEKHQVSILKGKLNSQLKESKKQSLIDLEIADYEKTVSSMQTEIHVKDNKIAEIMVDKEHLDERISSLQDEIACIESQKSEAENHYIHLKELHEKTKNELSELRETYYSETKTSEVLKEKLENSCQQYENVKMELSQLALEKRTLRESIDIMKENHDIALKSTNSKIIHLQNDLKLATKEKESYQRDFECYKTRVHSVYKQQKKQSNIGVETKDTEKHYEEVIDSLKTKLNDASLKLSTSKTENETLQNEIDSILERNARLSSDLESYNNSWSEKFQKAMEEKKQAIFEKKEIATSLHSEIDKLSENHKTQINIITAEHNRSFTKLEKQLEFAEDEIARLRHDCNSSDYEKKNLSVKEEEVLDVSLQERQEGEGSECTETHTVTPKKPPSLPLIHTTGFLPLDQLIQSSVPPASPTASISSSVPDSDVLSGKLSSSMKKVDHLTDLLTEAEETNMRLSEQTIVLKKEIRRLERNKEREEHSENLEYMKNVILKYLTIPVGDERSRLVPVLTTMLRLSPEENKYLQSAAGGDEASDEMNSTAGWGSFIHRWSGLS